MILAMLLASRKWLVVLLLILSIGTHRAILQMTAWVTMAAAYSTVLSFGKAIDQTFDGKHPCTLCKVVESTDSSDKDSNSQLSAKSFDLCFIPAAPVFFELLKERPVPFLAHSFSRTEKPPLPPPLA